jgi:hypothetical protein
VLLAAGSRDGDYAVGEPIEVVVARRQLHHRLAPVERTVDHVENHLDVTKSSSIGWTGCSAAADALTTLGLPRSGCARCNSTVTIARAQPSAGIF